MKIKLNDFRHRAVTALRARAASIETLKARGSYVAIALLVPGGIVLAAALWIYNRKSDRS